MTLGFRCCGTVSVQCSAHARVKVSASTDRVSVWLRPARWFQSRVAGLAVSSRARRSGSGVLGTASVKVSPGKLGFRCLRHRLCSGIPKSLICLHACSGVPHKPRSLVLRTASCSGVSAQPRVRVCGTACFRCLRHSLVFRCLRAQLLSRLCLRHSLVFRCLRHSLVFSVSDSLVRSPAQPRSFQVSPAQLVFSVSGTASCSGVVGKQACVQVSGVCAQPRFGVPARLGSVSAAQPGSLCFSVSGVSHSIVFRVCGTASCSALCSGVCGTASCSGVCGTASCSGVSGTALCSGVSGTALCSGVCGTASCSGVCGTASCSGCLGTASCSGVSGTASCSACVQCLAQPRVQVSGTASCSGVSGQPLFRCLGQPRVQVYAARVQCVSCTASCSGVRHSLVSGVSGTAWLFRCRGTSNVFRCLRSQLVFRCLRSLVSGVSAQPGLFRCSGTACVNVCTAARVCAQPRVSGVCGNSLSVQVLLGTALCSGVSGSLVSGCSAAQPRVQVSCGTASCFSVSPAQPRVQVVLRQQLVFRCLHDSVDVCGQPRVAVSTATHRVQVVFRTASFSVVSAQLVSGVCGTASCVKVSPAQPRVQVSPDSLCSGCLRHSLCSGSRHSLVQGVSGHSWCQGVCGTALCSGVCGTASWFRCLGQQLRVQVSRQPRVSGCLRPQPRVSGVCLRTARVQVSPAQPRVQVSPSTGLVFRVSGTALCFKVSGAQPGLFRTARVQVSAAQLAVVQVSPAQALCSVSPHSLVFRCLRTALCSGVCGKASCSVSAAQLVFRCPGQPRVSGVSAQPRVQVSADSLVFRCLRHSLVAGSPASLVFSVRPSSCFRCVADSLL
ncbi:hypothetical protein FKM82_027123 [Ascaphus truei]